jgi:hypothetical protein
MAVQHSLDLQVFNLPNQTRDDLAAQTATVTVYDAGWYGSTVIGAFTFDLLQVHKQVTPISFVCRSLVINVYKTLQPHHHYFRRWVALYDTRPESRAPDERRVSDTLGVAWKLQLLHPAGFLAIKYFGAGPRRRAVCPGSW